MQPSIPTDCESWGARVIRPPKNSIFFFLFVIFRRMTLPVFGWCVLLIRRVEIEINPGITGVSFATLAQDNCHLLVQRDAMAHAFAAVLISLDGFCHQRIERRLTILRNLVNAHDVFVVGFNRCGDFPLKVSTVTNLSLKNPHRN